MLALLSIGCGDANQKPSGLPQIDMNADYPEKEICLQDVADVSYIPLESKDDFLFRGKMEEVSSEGIAVIGDDKIYLFHPEGSRPRGISVCHLWHCRLEEGGSICASVFSESDICLFVQW